MYRYDGSFVIPLTYLSVGHVAGLHIFAHACHHVHYPYEASNTYCMQLKSRQSLKMSGFNQNCGGLY